MSRYARFSAYQQVRLKHDSPTLSDHPFTFLDVPRAVTTRDRGIIVDVHDIEEPGYEVEFFDSDGQTLDLLTLDEHEIEAWE